MAEGKAPDEIAVSPQPIASLDSILVCVCHTLEVYHIFCS
jgi:hypothetical protein